MSACLSAPLVTGPSAGQSSGVSDASGRVPNPELTGKILYPSTRRHRCGNHTGSKLGIVGTSTLIHDLDARQRSSNCSSHFGCHNGNLNLFSR